MDTNTEAARAWIERELHPGPWKGAQATIPCPLPQHEDKHASASVNAQDRVWKCHGCGEEGTLTDLAKRLNLERPAWHRNNGLSATRQRVYKYSDAAGHVVFEVVRSEPDRGKAYLQRHRDHSGKEIWMLPLAGRGLLYRLPQVLAAVTAGEPVCVVEGEKDADRLSKLGFASTCNAMGAGKWRAAHSKGIPAGADVVIFPDYDRGGMRHVEQVIASLLKAETFNSVCVVDLGFETRARHGHDVSEWLDADPARDAAAVQGLIAAATPAADWAAPAPRGPERPEKGAASEKDTRPVVEYQVGERLNWTREAIAKLVELGAQNDLTSLYATELVVQGSGASAGCLVSLYRAPEPEEGVLVQTPEGTLLMTQADDRDVQANIDEHLRWRKVQKNGEAIDADPARENAKEILARYKADSTRAGFPQFRILRGIVDTPTLRSDGTLLSKSGYDEKSGLYTDFKESDWPMIPSKLTRMDAQEALETIYDLVKESSFKDLHDRAVWVAFLLSIVARSYIGGNVPVFGFSANAARLGKGTLVDLAAIVATNKGVTKWAPVSAARTADVENEERKRLMAVALSGIRVLCIDNVKAGELMGTPALDMVITSGDNSTYGRIADRVLGVTGIAETPWKCVVSATGNNLRVRGDMGGRSLLCKLETHHVDPEMIQYHHHPDPHRYAREHRKKLLVAALTLLLAHKQAIDDGDPDALLPRIGSFGRWSDRIRSAVWWADPNRCDPWDGNAEVKANAQPEQLEALMFFEALHSAFGTAQVSVKDIAQRCSESWKSCDPDLAEAAKMLSISAPRGNAEFNTRSLGQWLAAHKDRPGRFVLREGDRKSGKLLWYIEKTPSSSVVSLIEIAIQSLMDVFPKLTDERSEVLRTAFHGFELTALSELYQTGQELEEAIKEASEPVGEVVNATLRKPDDGMSDRQRAALRRWNALESLTIVACGMLPAGAVYEDARKRFNKLGVTRFGRESPALAYLKIADWEIEQVGAPRSAGALVEKAIELKNAELSRDPSKNEYFAPDLDAAIRELAGLQPRKDADPEEPEQVAQELDIY